MHTGLIAADASLCAVAGLQCELGVLHYVEEGAAVLGHFRVACRAGKADGSKLLNCKLRKFFLNGLYCPCGHFVVAVVSQQESEIVAAYSCCKSSRSYEFIEDVREILQHIVSVAVSDGVVDDMEAVDVQNYHPEGVAEDFT